MNLNTVILNLVLWTMDISNCVDFVVESDGDEDVSMEISLPKNAVGLNLNQMASTPLPVTPTRTPRRRQTRTPRRQLPTAVDLDTSLPGCSRGMSWYYYYLFLKSSVKMLKMSKCVR